MAVRRGRPRLFDVSPSVTIHCSALPLPLLRLRFSIFFCLSHGISEIKPFLLASLQRKEVRQGLALENQLEVCNTTPNTSPRKSLHLALARLPRLATVRRQVCSMCYVFRCSAEFNLSSLISGSKNLSIGSKAAPASLHSAG